MLISFDDGGEKVFDVCIWCLYISDDVGEKVCIFGWWRGCLFLDGVKSWEWAKFILFFSDGGESSEWAKFLQMVERAQNEFPLWYNENRVDACDSCLRRNLLCFFVLIFSIHTFFLQMSISYIHLNWQLSDNWSKPIFLSSFIQASMYLIGCN